MFNLIKKLLHREPDVQEITGEYLEKLINDMHNDCKGDAAAKRLTEVREELKVMNWYLDRFPTDDKDKTSSDGKLLAFLVGMCSFCPACNTESIGCGPRGGVSINMVCTNCGARYWMMDPEYAFATDLRFFIAFGAYTICGPDHPQLKVVSSN